MRSLIGQIHPISTPTLGFLQDLLTDPVQSGDARFAAAPPGDGFRGIGRPEQQLLGERCNSAVSVPRPQLPVFRYPFRSKHSWSPLPPKRPNGLLVYRRAAPLCSGSGVCHCLRSWILGRHIRCWNGWLNVWSDLWFWSSVAPMITLHRLST